MVPSTLITHSLRTTANKHPGKTSFIDIKKIKKSHRHQAVRITEMVSSWSDTVRSLYSGIRPPEMRIHLLKKARDCPCGGLII